MNEALIRSRSLRSAHTARLSRRLQPPSPRQPPRQSRGLLALLDGRTRSLRSKRRIGKRKSLDNRNKQDTSSFHAAHHDSRTKTFTQRVCPEFAAHSHAANWTTPIRPNGEQWRCRELLRGGCACHAGCSPQTRRAASAPRSAAPPQSLSLSR